LRGEGERKRGREEERETWRQGDGETLTGGVHAGGGLVGFGASWWKNSEPRCVSGRVLGRWESFAPSLPGAVTRDGVLVDLLREEGRVKPPDSKA
jgi:hypothetical protein